MRRERLQIIDMLLNNLPVINLTFEWPVNQTHTIPPIDTKTTDTYDREKEDLDLR